MSARRAGGRACAWMAAAGSLLLAACAGAPPKSPPPQTKVVVENHGTFDQKPKRSPYAPAQEDLSKRGNYTAGGLYAPGVKDSAPQGGIPDVHLIPEPEVRAEPRSRYGNRSPYKVLGKSYRVLDSAEGYA
ncbi:MAG TPA: septal ring lytic transglycosylase RlpA family protein, partial [Luteimonas sp.]